MRSDYDTIALCFRCDVGQSPNVCGHTIHYSLASRLALEFELDDPDFDRDRFMRACGVEG